MRFLRKLTLRYPEKTLLLKSPAHTAKVRTILSLFPDAKFIHIRRNPYIVFASWQRYQNYTQGAGDGVQSFVEYYARHYSPYLLQRALIPDGNLYEMRHEDLVSSPLEETKKAYGSLGLDFSECREAMEYYLEEIKNYKQNNHPPLTPAQRAVIDRSLATFLEAFEY